MIITLLFNQTITKSKLCKWQGSRDLMAEILENRLEYPGEDEPSIPTLRTWLEHLDKQCSI
jgi:hypothetical protein